MATKDIKFIFVCPTQNNLFESAEFRVIENKGVLTDEAGRKTLDAKVVLNEPCPFCGQEHVYHASELSCPFTGSQQRWNNTIGKTHGRSKKN